MHLQPVIVALLSALAVNAFVLSLSDSETALGQIYRRPHRGASVEAHMYGEASRHLNRLHARQLPSSSSSSSSSLSSSTSSNAAPGPSATPSASLPTTVTTPTAAASATKPMSTASAVPLTNETAVDPKMWDAQTAAACARAVWALDGRALSKSGITVCYNVPALDNSTGAFQADVRLYRIAAPTGAWAGVADDDITVSLSYAGASVRANPHARRRRRKRDAAGDGVVDDDESLTASPLSVAALQKRETMMQPMFLQTLSFWGQLNQSYMDTPMTLTQLVTLMAPNVTLLARARDGARLATQLTAKEASFVNGVFAGSPIGAASAREASAAPPPFVLPGTALAVAPVGLAVAGAWAAAGAAVLAWGTVGRYRFRQQYRRRKLREHGGVFRP